jgi:hypothetical protein
MRRFVIICLLMILPLHWSWSVAASVCAHETEGTAQHLGHHQHEHAQADASLKNGDADTAPDDAAGADARTGIDTDCHSHGVIGMINLESANLTFWPGSEFFGQYACQIPDHKPGQLLRPPSSRLA